MFPKYSLPNNWYNQSQTLPVKPAAVLRVVLARGGGEGSAPGCFRYTPRGADSSSSSLLRLSVVLRPKSLVSTFMAGRPLPLGWPPTPIDRWGVGRRRLPCGLRGRRQRRPWPAPKRSLERGCGQHDLARGQDWGGGSMPRAAALPRTPADTSGATRPLGTTAVPQTWPLYRHLCYR